MISITAVIRTRKGHEQTMRKALLDVVDNAARNETGTVGFFVSQDNEDPCVFTTYERFIDSSAMDAHNKSETVARFFGVAKPILDGDVILKTCTEIPPRRDDIEMKPDDD